MPVMMNSRVYSLNNYNSKVRKHGILELQELTKLIFLHLHYMNIPSFISWSENQERDTMSNELTHALAASAMQCTLNLMMGESVFNANVFLAAVLAMVINLDRFGGSASSGNGTHRSRMSSRSPIGHSVGSGLIWIYLSYLFIQSLNAYADVRLDHTLVIVVISAISTHLFLDHMDGGIYLIPTNTDPSTWFKKHIPGEKKTWPAWSGSSMNKQVRAAGRKSGKLIIFRPSQGTINMVLAMVLVSCLVIT